MTTLRNARASGIVFRQAFTLVELLVVISIIGILMGIAVPVIGSVMNKVRVNAVKLETTAIENAIENYRETHGDYPPDFSSWSVVQRHYRKVFPRIGTNDFELLYNMLHDLRGTVNDKSDDIFRAANMDRAEALVWALGGYSENIQRPFTGPGGPLTWVGDGMTEYAAASDPDRQVPGNYQISSDHPNAFHDFDLERFNYTTIDTSSLLTGTNRYLSTDDGDLFLTYAAGNSADNAPYVYFDSRTYQQFDPELGMMVVAEGYNGYFNADFGGVRPFVGALANANNSGADFSDLNEALDAWNFVNPDTFQVISAGLDNNFGPLPILAVASFGNTDPEPIYYQYPTGTAIAPRTDVDTPGELIIDEVSKFQTATLFSDSENPLVDNVANFSSSEIGLDVTE